MDLKLKTKLEMFRNTEHENFYNGSSKGMGTISNNTAGEMYELINGLECALIKAETNQDKALNLAVVSASLLPEDVSIRDVKNIRQYLMTHAKTIKGRKALATIISIIDHLESVSNAR